MLGTKLPDVPKVFLIYADAARLHTNSAASQLFSYSDTLHLCACIDIRNFQMLPIQKYSVAAIQPRGSYRFRQRSSQLVYESVQHQCLFETRGF